MGEKQSSWDFRAVYGVFVVGAVPRTGLSDLKTPPDSCCCWGIYAAGVVGAVGAAPGDASSGYPVVPGTMLGDATPELSDATPEEAEKV